MTDTMLETLRFPVGRFKPTASATHADRVGWIDSIAATPARIAALVDGLDARALGTAYRPDGWTVAQVVHHMADSHMNAYVRTRFILTEPDFTIKPYNEKAWATLPDATLLDVTPSLALLRGLHARWTTLLRSLEPADFDRQYIHPESGPGTLDKLVQLYEWHGRHHGAHIAHVRG
jgi:DinB superfamily